MSTRNFINSIPPVTRHLLIINIVVWLATSAMYHLQGFDVTRWLGLHYVEAPAFNPVQLVTYMFLHDTNSFAHIFFNMFSLYIFGKILEQVMGSKRFLTYYMVCGVGAALIQEAAMAYSLHPIVANYEGVDLGHGMIVPTMQFLDMNVAVGASGAVFGILLAFGMFFPNAPLYLFFIPVPIKSKYMVIGYGLIELLFGVSGTISGVAHFAHLGGLLFGLLLILYWKKKGIINRSGF